MKIEVTYVEDSPEPSQALQLYKPPMFSMGFWKYLVRFFLIVLVILFVLFLIEPTWFIVPIWMHHFSNIKP